MSTTTRTRARPVLVERALKNNKLFLTRLDALGILQRWNEIDELLTRSDLSFDPSVVESFRARTAQERNATLDAELHWSHAVALAAGDPFKLRFVANFAEHSHATAAALKAFETTGQVSEHAALLITESSDKASKPAKSRRNLLPPKKFLRSRPRTQMPPPSSLISNLLLETDVEANLATAKKAGGKVPEPAFVSRDRCVGLSQTP